MTRVDLEGRTNALISPPPHQPLVSRPCPLRRQIHTRVVCLKGETLILGLAFVATHCNTSFDREMDDAEFPRATCEGYWLGDLALWDFPRHDVAIHPRVRNSQHEAHVKHVLSSSTSVHHCELHEYALG